MSVEIIRYVIPEGREAEFEQAYEQAQAYLAGSPHCLGYELFRCEEEPQRYLLRIDWTSTTDHLNGFRKSPEFPAFVALVRPFIENIKEMQHYHGTSVRST